MTLSLDRPWLADFRRNGRKVKPTFSAAEFRRRHGDIRKHMAADRLDAALFTSYHNICYLSDFLYCQFGRRYGLVIDHDKATSISSAIDGGHPWRRTAGDSVTYTDWSKDNYFHAVRGLTVSRLTTASRMATISTPCAG